MCDTLVLLAIALPLLARTAIAAPKVSAVDIDGMVHPVTVEIVSRALERAKTENASLVLVRLNTPGGLMDAMRATIEKIVASPVPVVTYVAPSGGRAASAGFFILESGDMAAMAPGHQYRRCASGRDGRRNGRRHEAEGGERRRRLSAQHLRQTRTQQRPRGDGGAPE